MQHANLAHIICREHVCCVSARDQRRLGDAARQAISVDAVIGGPCELPPAGIGCDHEACIAIRVQLLQRERVVACNRHQRRTAGDRECARRCDADAKTGEGPGAHARGHMRDLGVAGFGKHLLEQRADHLSVPESVLGAGLGEHIAICRYDGNR